MKSVLISIKPKWCELIVAGKKTVELRKTKPKLEPPFKVYIYCTRPKRWFKYSSCGCASDESLWLSDGKVEMCDGFKYWCDGGDYTNLNGKVIGEFVCDRVYRYASDMFRSTPVEGTDISTEDITKLSCLTAKELYEYEHSVEPKENCINLVGVYGWHISDLKVYDKPKALDEFFYACDKKKGTDCSVCIGHRENKCKSITRPPQSWCYVEEVT